jgi:ubiquinone/menaquinone biosynthesis C-methylase UbiE
VEFLRQHHPEMTIHGLEPVEELLHVVRQKLGRDGLVCGDGRHLPYGDHAYDVVIETGILHHVKRPEIVVKEMERVANRAIFISDHNIFGQGTMSSRMMKWALYKCGLWTLAKLILTKGKGYHISEGDGLAYSYSVYFQYRMLRAWAARTFVIPLRSAGTSYVPFGAPWFSADEVLLCALRTDISHAVNLQS